MSLSTLITNLAVRVGTEAKALRTLINGNAADLSALTTTDKSSLVAAANELKAAIGAIDVGDAIDDTATASDTTWSSSKIATEIDAAIDGLVDGAPTAYDTLIEIANYIAMDESLGASLTAALDKRVRFDDAQVLDAAEQAQARSNIGAVAAAAVGDTDADFVATFNAALA